MEFFKKKSIPILCIIGAIMAIGFTFLTGLRVEGDYYRGEVLVASISVIGLIFGKGKLVTNFEEVPTYHTGGTISIFALISFIIMIIGIGMCIISLILNVKNLDVFSGAVVVVASLLMLLIKVAGTNMENMFGDVQKFSIFFKEYSLGVGTILYAIIPICAFIIGFIIKKIMIINSYKKKKYVSKKRVR